MGESLLKGLLLKGVFLKAAIVVIALTACTQSGADVAVAAGTAVSHDSAEAGDADIPRIYVDRVFEKSVDKGTNFYLNLYQEALSMCQEAGASTKPLSPDDEARVGTERWQYWRVPGRLAYRVESWEFATGETPSTACHFDLQTSEARHAYFDREKTVYLDMLTGESRVAPPKPENLGAYDLTADNDRYAAEPGWDGPNQQAVLGQPCNEWQHGAAESICVWSAGEKWGFSAGPHADLQGGTPSTHRIDLKIDPPPNGTGARLTTRRFNIDQGIDLDEILPAEVANGM
ncbi:hypothetical protein [Marilutibacter alkalisoli]|uniref:Uncharacterized protein n=1 Tax=Marilutibacter alkalisoli TaxID=2591633 RepID=A0A514BW49_9GAMM|nr:hypothetical protein [Lysobacter alkalisoli]QDH71597.1 hypothetical protein FKV23_16965 [Lysobacter alkalisoli]